MIEPNPIVTNTKCSYCEQIPAYKCSTCDSFACKEHMYFNREGNELHPVCINCYEGALRANCPLKEEM